MLVIRRDDSPPVVREQDDLSFLGALWRPRFLHFSLLPEECDPEDSYKAEHEHDPIEPKRAAAAKRITSSNVHRFTYLTL